MKNTALITALALITAAPGCNDSAPDEAGPDTGPDTVLSDTGSADPDDAHTQPPDAPTPAALAFEVPKIDGTPTNLADYHGRVVLIVNTASECGLTPQYEQLQALHEQYADDGLAILGFPANNFGAQEPGSNEEIAAFCQENYGVDFDMFAKVSVKGDDQHPLYTFLTDETTNPGLAGEITWNFEKFLIDRAGNVVARFEPRTRPDAPEVVAAIEAALAQ